MAARRPARGLALVVTALALALPAAASAAGVTYGGDDLRTSWYPDQASLTPQLVTGGTFGRLFSAPVDGQVYAQPLMSNGTLFVATESDWIYGLDPVSGAQQWARNVGTPWNPADVGCADLTPTIGITGTPVIDGATHTAYFFAKTYASGTSGPAVWKMHAVDTSTGAERGGFPVQIGGEAQNRPGTTFDPTHEMQRPGLLLMDGVVYAAFGGHCDALPYQGWVFGVSTSGAVKARWASAPNYAGIWQSGGGVVSDGSGQIVVATGNGYGPTGPLLGTDPPGNLGESVVRLSVQSDGSLRATDFFSPYDAVSLDDWDGDLGSGGPLALPSTTFGTSSYPHLLVIAGKEGYVYLLDRDHLGGIAEGASGGDAVVARIGPYGGVWSRPAVWPGDGGYVYMPTASPSADTPGLSYGGVLRAYRYGVDGSGKPTLALAGTSTDVYGFGSGGPVVTSDGTSSGSAIVWILWSSDSTGTGAQLRAYSAVPVNGHPSLIWSAPVGTASKFAVPGVAGNRVYVGTRDGHVLGFGAPVTAPLSGAAVAFPATTVGATSNRTATFTASRSLTVTGVDVSGSQFGHGAPTPTTLSSGDTLSVPVSFTPGSSGLKSGTLTVHTSAGDASVGLSGAGRAATAQLSATPGLVSFGGTTVGGALSSTLTLANSGGTDLTLSHVASPGAPFHATGVPPDGTVLAPGSSVDVTLSFEPAAVGGYTDSVAIDSSAGSETVNLSGTATTPPRLEVSPASLDFGTAALGATASRSFTLSNTGGGPLTINKSKPPITGPFAASTALPEGTVIPAGGSATETVTFSPAASGPASDVWVITGNDGSGAHDVSFSGAGADATAPQQQQSRGGSPAPLLPGVGTVVAATRAKPVLSKLKVTSRRRISFRLSRAARVRLAVERVTRVRGCAGHLTCLRYRAAGASWTVSGRAGANSVRFGSRPHRSGKYVLAATPLGGIVRHASFKVKR